MSALTITQAPRPSHFHTGGQHELRLVTSFTEPTSDNPGVEPCVFVEARWGGNVVDFDLIREEVEQVALFLQSWLKREASGR